MTYYDIDKEVDAFLKPMNKASTLSILGTSALILCSAISYAASSEWDDHSAPKALGSDERKVEVCGYDNVYKKDSIEDYQPYGLGYKPFKARVRLLADPHEALTVRLLAIRSAKYTIDLSTYIFHDDDASFAVLDELRSAIRDRGVSVRMLIDSLGSLSVGELNHQNVKSLLFVTPGVNPYTGKKATVDVAVFSPLVNIHTFGSWVMDTLKGVADKDSTTININRRSHDKILIIDGEFKDSAIAIVGGRNISNDYFAFPTFDQTTYEDMEVVVSEPVQHLNDETLGSTIVDHFNKLFCHKGNDWLTPGLTRDIGNQIDGTSNRVLSQLGVDLNKKFQDTRSFPAEVTLLDEIENIKRSGDDISLQPAWRVEDDPKNSPNGNSIVSNTMRAIANAQSEIDFVSPYFYLTDNEIGFLKRWVMQKSGRRVRIISSSVFTTDVALSQAVADSKVIPALLATGAFSFSKGDGNVEIGNFDNSGGKIQVYELGRLDSKLFGGAALYGKLHAKYVIIDQKIAVVSSNNFDPRSRNLNSETGFMISDAEAAQELHSEFTKLLNRSYLWGSPKWQTLIQRDEVKTQEEFMKVISMILSKVQSLEVGT